MNKTITIFGLALLMLSSTAFAKTSYKSLPLYTGYNNYASEFFWEKDRGRWHKRGNCGAAAIENVEHQIDKARNGYSSNKRLNWVDIKSTTDNMKRYHNVKRQGQYYITHIKDMRNKLEKDGYSPILHVTSNKETAIKKIHQAIRSGSWVILLARSDYSQNQLGHFFPVFKYKKVTDRYGRVDTNKSTITSIQTFYKGRRSKYPTTKLSKVLASMKSASQYGYYNFIEVRGF